MPKFTDTYLAGLQLKPGQKDRIVFDEGCPGLGVRVTPKKRIFVCQWTDPVTRRKLREKLGVWGQAAQGQKGLTISAARKAVQGRLGDIAKGIDIVAEKQRRKAHHEAQLAKAELTLDALIGKWADERLSARRLSYAKEATRALRAAFRDHLKKPASDLTRAQVKAVLGVLKKRGNGTAAGRTLAYGRACYSWAAKDDLVQENPFQGQQITSRTSERDRVLTDDELMDIVAAATALPDPWGPFYLLALYTMQRRDEVAGMRRSEIAPDLSLWSISAARMKNNRAHDVHLPEPARALLRSIPVLKGQDLVFSTNGRTPISGFSKAKLMLDAKIAELRAERAKRTGTEPAPVVPWRLHDFRRSGVTKLARLGFDSIVVDKLLAHKPAKLTGVASVYQRHDFADERKRALEAWVSFLTSSPADNVIAFSDRQAAS